MDGLPKLVNRRILRDGVEIMPQSRYCKRPPAALASRLWRRGAEHMSGLQWIRRRQRTLARAVLPLVALAWLQVAAIPCVAAHQSAGLVAATSHPAADPPVGHDHAAHDPSAHHHGAHDAPPGADHGPCLYCPPDHAGHAGADEAGSRCAFPHDPQVDARVAGLAVAPPVVLTSFALPPEPAQTGARLPADRPAPVPRSPLTVSYCRFIE
jgi:hypothetical protein